jgi:hypothetical protein
MSIRRDDMRANFFKIAFGYFHIQLFYISLENFYAERGGFEPPVQSPAHMISNHAPSATRTPLLKQNHLFLGSHH